MVNEDRGQLLLVAAVLIALVIVASAVLLNGLVTPETATTSSLSTDATEFDRSMGSIHTDLGDLFAHSTSVEEHGVALPYAEESDFQPTVDDAYGPIYRDELVNKSGAVLDLAYIHSDSRTGNVVFNQSLSNFTNQPGPAGRDWTMASDVQAITRGSFVFDREFEDGGDATRIRVDNGSHDWSVAVSQTALHVDGGPAVCDGAIDPTYTERIVFDVEKPSNRTATATVFNSTTRRIDCTHTFEFGGDVAKPWDVSIENGDEAEGTYALAFDGSLGPGVSAGPWPESETGVVINPAIHVTYVSEGIDYESRFRLYNETQ